MISELTREALRQFIESQKLKVVSLDKAAGFSAVECPNCHTGAFYQKWIVIFSDPELNKPVKGAAITMNDEIGFGMMGPLKGSYREAANLLLSTVCRVCHPDNRIEPQTTNLLNE